MILLLLALIVIGNLWRSRGESSYLFASRDVGLLPLTATLVMTEFNTSTLIAFSSLGSLFGRSALFFPFIFLVALLFYAFTVARRWKSYNGYSVAGFFAERYGPAVARMASLSLLLAMAGFSATYVKSLTLLFAPMIALSPWPLSLLLVAAALAMTYRGGLVSIVATDVVSFLLISLFFALALLYSPGELTSRPVDPKLITSLTVLAMFTYILAPWYGHKMFSARSEKVALLSVALAALLVFLLYGAAILLTARTGKLLPEVIGALPSPLRSLGYGVLFAASATTLTGVWNAMGAMIVGDYLRPTQSNVVGKRIVLIAALTSWLLANLFVDRVFDKLILANIPIAALAYSLLAGFYWKGANSAGAICSIITGLTWGIGCYLTQGPNYIWPWVMYGLPLSCGAGIAGSLASTYLQRPVTSS